jgi:hypothetical protein
VVTSIGWPAALIRTGSAKIALSLAVILMPEITFAAAKIRQGMTNMMAPVQAKIVSH